VVAAIGHGLLALVGVAVDDTSNDRDYLVRKIAEMRIFDDANGVMNLCVRDVAGDVLAVSQFTLYASMRKGNRPSWSRAAPPDVAKPAFDEFVAALSKHLDKPVPSGVFGAHMLVHLVNDGPVTIALDSRERE
jgi:D-tyrosyl-tRNA(Tyr) deacylase